MIGLTRIFRTFSTINAQFLSNKSRNAVRFESQNTIWDYQQVNYHAMAFAKGLKNLSFASNDCIMLRLPPAQQSQAYVSQLGAAAIGARVIASQANTAQQLQSQLTKNNVKAFIFQPTLPTGNQITIDVINQLIPQLNTIKQGQSLSSQKFTSLSLLVQTGFYSYPGVYKYRNILNYAKDQYYVLSSLNDSLSPLQLPNSSLPLVLTNACGEFALKAGILNNVINGRYVIFSQPSDLARLCQVHNNQIQILATQDIKVPSQVKVFVQRGSNICSNHSNRTQI